MRPDLGVALDAAADDALAPQLLEPTYQNRLRVVGRRLDANVLHRPAIIEVDGGFIVRAHRGNRPAPILIEVFDRDFPRLIREAIKAQSEVADPPYVSSLVPTGYEDLLRAIGYELDERIAENVAVTEYPGFISVTGVELALEPGAEGYRTFSEILTRIDTRQILDEALMRRGTVEIPQVYIPPSLRDMMDGS